MAKRNKREDLEQEVVKAQPVGKANGKAAVANAVSKPSGAGAQSSLAKPKQTLGAALKTEQVVSDGAGQKPQGVLADRLPTTQMEQPAAKRAETPVMAQQTVAPQEPTQEVALPKAKLVPAQNSDRVTAQEPATASLSLADAVVPATAQDNTLAQLMQLAQQTAPNVSSRAEAEHALSDYHYIQSTAVKDAYDALEDYQTREPEEYNSTYQQQIDGLLDQILNREDFAYDFDADPLYQQYKNQYEHAGRLAMQDTMAQLQGATGGYGSSYGAQAASGAYQSYLNQLTGQMPELYQMAYSVYQDKGDGMRDNLAALNTQEKAAQQQYQDELDAYHKGLSVATNAAESAYEKDYGQFSDNRNYLEDLLGYYAGQEQQAVDNEQARLNYELAVKKQEEAVRQAEADRAQKQNQWWAEFMAEQQAKQASASSHVSTSTSSHTSTKGGSTSSAVNTKPEGVALSDKALDLKHTITKEMQNLAASDRDIDQAEINKQAKSIIASYYRTGLITQTEANSLGTAYGATF